MDVHPLPCLPPFPVQHFSHGNGGNQRAPAPSKSVLQPRIPPIVVPNNRNYTQLLRSFQVSLTSVKVEEKCQGASLKTSNNSVPYFRLVQAFLTERKIFSHLCTPFWTGNQSCDFRDPIPCRTQLHQAGARRSRLCAMLERAMTAVTPSWLNV